MVRYYGIYVSVKKKTRSIGEILMLMETEYLKMKCKKYEHDEWAAADISDELATYYRKKNMK